MTAFGGERLLEVAEAALGVAGADDVEALVARQAGGLTRFASSRIHQSAWREDLSVRVRVVVDGNRVGTATVHDADPAAVRAAARRAAEVAQKMPPDTGYPGMPGPADYPRAGRYDGPTAAADPGTRAGLVAGVIRRLPAGVTAAGACETRELEIAVANARGVRAAGATTAASFSLLADAGSGTGWAEGTEPALADLDVAALGERAARKAVDSREPRDLAPGIYPVVLEPTAASVLVRWLGWLGFGAKAYDEGRSFLVGRLGQRVCSPLVTIVDDAAAPDTIGVGFDFEGVPRRRVTLIDQGVAASLVYDFRAAARHGVEPTGHGLPAPSAEGALPMHMAMQPGQTSQAELVAGLERGLLITRFHYTNLVNLMDTTVTGMTRDGTFWIEDGQVVAAVRNLRFTQSILEALSAIRAVGSETEMAIEDGYGAARAPALAIDRFAFSSATTF
ncbi:MAG TPA: metallopeptidase TldD-related protein [Actinomycetes bacterium]|nr:metallopeptidase TldD-related protein [Actinomycetes bacterium]